MTAYPSFDEAREDLVTLFEAVTKKSDARLSKVANAAWNVQGMLQGLLIPDGPTTAAIDDVGHTRLSDPQAVLALGTLLDCEDSENTMRAQGFFGGGAREGMLSGGLRGGIAKLLLPMILSWITKWIEDGGLTDWLNSLIGTSATDTPDASATSSCGASAEDASKGDAPAAKS